MNDTELLTLAAKAARIEWRKDWLAYLNEEGLKWNPLTDDGDALRLAVKLGIQVVSHKNGMSQALWSSDTPSGFAVRNEAHEDDPYAATRRAIVRAAAEIGKEMK